MSKIAKLASLSVAAVLSVGLLGGCTDQQAREMSGQPDLILQLAHHIGDAFEAEGHRGVQVNRGAGCQ